jgi:hypothetical protein
VSVGFVVDKNQVDSNAGNLSRQIEILTGQILDFQAYLETAPEETLTSPPFSYTADEVALLKSAFNDLSLLARIYNGDDVLTEARDLGVFSRRLAGLIV